MGGRSAATDLGPGRLRPKPTQARFWHLKASLKNLQKVTDLRPVGKWPTWAQTDLGPMMGQHHQPPPPQQQTTTTTTTTTNTTTHDTQQHTTTTTTHNTQHRTTTTTHKGGVGGPKGGRGPKFRAFFPLPPPFSLFSLSEGPLVSFLSLWWFYLVLQAAGVSHDSPRAQTCTFDSPGLQKITKIPREDLQREKKRQEKTSRERKKDKRRPPEREKKRHKKTPRERKKDTRGPPEREKKSENGRGRGKRRAKCWAVRRRAVRRRGVQGRGSGAGGPVQVCAPKSATNTHTNPHPHPHQHPHDQERKTTGNTAAQEMLTIKGEEQQATRPRKKC